MHANADAHDIDLDEGVDDGDAVAAMRPALAVSGEPDFSSDAPLTAEEYLRRVRWEAQRAPKAVRAAVVVLPTPPAPPAPTSPSPLLATTAAATAAPPSALQRALYIPASPALVLPRPEWQQRFLSHIVDTRQSLFHFASRVAPAAHAHSTLAAVAAATMLATNPSQPHATHTAHSRARSRSHHHRPHASPSLTARQCLGAYYDTAAAATAGDPRDDDRTAYTVPTPRLLAQLDQVATRALLDDLSQHLLAALQRVVDSRTPTIVALTRVLSRAHAHWLFALLLRLDKPLPADTAASLRQLYRTLGRLRAQLGELARAAAPDEAANEATAAAAPSISIVVDSALDRAFACNLLMTLVDGVFGQRVEVMAMR